MIAVTLYRCTYVSIGCYAAAALAPDKPMKHAIILGAIGFVLEILGAVAMWHEPPHRYPIALVILGAPSAWEVCGEDTVGKIVSIDKMPLLPMNGHDN